MASPLHNLGLRFAYTVSTNIRPEMVTAHYGGPTPWPASADRSTPTRFRDTTNHAQCPSIVRAYHDFHINGRGWAGFAYSSAVCPHGHRYEGRGRGRRTGANGTNAGNLRSYATVYLAGKTDSGRFDPLTDEAKHAFLDEAERLGRPLLRNHSDWKSTDCAGSPIREWQHAGWPRPNTLPGGDDMTPAQEAKLDQALTILRNLEVVKVPEWNVDSNTDVIWAATLRAAEGASATSRAVLAAVTGAKTVDPQELAKALKDSLGSQWVEDLKDAIGNALLEG